VLGWVSESMKDEPHQQSELPRNVCWNNNNITTMTLGAHPPSRAARALKVSIVLVISLFSISLLYAPTGGSILLETISRNHNTQKSIDERVKHILNHTPLIGNQLTCPPLLLPMHTHFANHIFGIPRRT